MTTKRSSGQYELILENRQLVFIFFGAVLLCAIFFALGFLLGRDQRDIGWRSGAASTENAAADSTPKTSTQQPSSAPQAAAPKISDQDAINKELTFYKTVEGKSPPKDYEAKNSTSRAAVQEKSSPTAQPDASMAAKTTSVPTPQPASGTILFQVAALSKSIDAEALVRKLKEQGFQAFIVSPPAGSTGDKLYRVQVGPFSNSTVSEQVRAQLVASGYKPITRR